MQTSWKSLFCVNLSCNKSGCWVNALSWLDKITREWCHTWKYSCVCLGAVKRGTCFCYKKLNYSLLFAATFRNLQKPHLLQDVLIPGEYARIIADISFQFVLHQFCKRSGKLMPLLKLRQILIRLVVLTLANNAKFELLREQWHFIRARAHDDSW